MAREHESDIRLQQEQDGSARQIEWRIQQAHTENAFSAAEMQEVIRVQGSAVQQLNEKVDEQAHPQATQVERQQAEYGRTEREIMVLRENLDNEREARARNDWRHNEKYEETQDQVLMQELESQELRSLIEVMVCEQRESNTRVQQERNDAAREMERRLRKVQVDIADNEARVQELESKVQEDTRTQAEHLRLERERTEYEMAELGKSLRDEKMARLQEADRAQKHATQDLDKRDEAMAIAQRERNMRLEQEHSKTAQEITRQLQKIQADITGNGTQVQEALHVQGLAVDQLKSQMASVVADILLGDQPLRKALRSLATIYSEDSLYGCHVNVFLNSNGI